MNRLKDIFAYRDMIRELVHKELRGRYQKSVLGFFWNFLNPLFQILVYTIIFTYIFPSNIQDFYIYLSIGLIPWTFFNESLSLGTASIVNNGDMVKKIYFPREVLVISSVCAKFVNLVISLAIVFLFIVFSGRLIVPRTYLYLPLVMITEFILALGFSLLLSSIDVYLRDMEYIVNVIMMAAIWASPVMYDINAVSERLRPLLYYVPMTPIIIGYHNIMYHGIAPDMTLLLEVLVLGVALVIVGEIVFLHAEKNFAEEL